MKTFRKRRSFFAKFFLLVILGQIVRVPALYALTSGPTQPEVQTFQPASTTELVDLFTGDFGYNIPLFELPGPNGGYPFNLSYQSSVSMDQEASWVGLGWNLNPGAISRQMRGLPDEFKGDSIYTKMSIAPNVTVGVGLGTGVELFGGALGLGTGLSVYQNNYSGIGYTIDGSVSFSKATSSGSTAGIGLNVSLDSKEGVNVSPSLSLGGKTGQYGLQAGYNSKQGLTSISTTYNPPKKSDPNQAGTKQANSNEEKRNQQFSSITGGASISLAHPGYTPQLTMAMKNLNLSGTFKIGGAWWGVYFSGYVTGFYNEQTLRDDKKRIASKAYGYLNYQEATDAGALRDINREKDGMITKEAPNLAMPSMTYDIYSVNGQGISGMYRPMRNDIGIIHDQEVSSTSIGGTLGVDVGIPSHVGVNASVNHSKSTSGSWSEGNNVTGAKFLKKNLNDLYEPWYFKVHGEPTSASDASLNSIGGTDAVRVQLTDDDQNYNTSAQNTLENSSWSANLPDTSFYQRQRQARNNAIQPITNAELLKGSQEIVSLFKINYDSAGYQQKFNRKKYPKHHTAGFTALTPQGLRYVYGIPAYNQHHEEVTFSAKKISSQSSRVNVGSGSNGDPQYQISNTEKFLKRVEIPPYAHSYLLTAIVGPDYVDVLNDGVTQDDLGYWVKFTYTKTTTQVPFKWRDPFAKAHFIEGWKTDPRDDKGSFTYGEKELWYLTKAETKSHVAEFTLVDREDGHGVATKLQDGNSLGKAVSALQQIKLYTRAAGPTDPIKVVKFQYDYSLCRGIYNSSSGNGKLTLKKLWFEYGNSLKGSLSPYTFTYHANNPNYDQYAYDRWGNYKPYPAGNEKHNVDFPYAEQDPSLKNQIDQNAAAWSLVQIGLPSGGQIVIDYESDDYAYVQDQQAMQMTNVVAPWGDPMAQTYTLQDTSLRVQFKLEHPIVEELTRAQREAEVLKYLDQERGQLGFKLKMQLRKPVENFQEFITGYADVDFDKPHGMGLTKDQSGSYAYGYFYLKAEQGHHPFSMRAWQHLRTNQPDIANSGKTLKQTDDDNERAKQIKSLGSVIDQVSQMFKGFYNYCDGQGWGKQIICSESVIRLNSADKIKYGGGLRVRQITMTDNWKEGSGITSGTNNSEGIYGQVYDYTKQEGDQIISSGVAAYEPVIGGEENALHYVKKYTQSIPLHADNNLFFEYPVNESYYPGPQVGYSKITVTSLAAASLLGKTVSNILLSNGKSLFPTGDNASYGTTGATVHEFYTANDFPVITQETDKLNRPFKLAVTIPLLGSIGISKLATSQGYSIITNDMHGKPKQVSNYRQTKSGALETEPISWIKYNYRADTIVHNNKAVLSLKNSFKDNGDGTLSALTSADESNPSVSRYTIGQEHDFIMDMRQFQDDAWGGGAYVNLDAIYLLFAVIPVPSAWPSISKSETQLRTSVTNKVIFKTGILASTEAYDGGSRVITNNLKWDKATGGVVLTSVNNNFDAPLYNYSVMAHTKYQGMGAAFVNTGLTLRLKNVNNLNYHNNFYEFAPEVASGSLYPGDELLLYANDNKFLSPIAKVVYTGEENGDQLLYSDVVLAQSDYQALIIRSGYRNQLQVSAGTITALQDPSRNGSVVTHNKLVTVPK